MEKEDFIKHYYHFYALCQKNVLILYRKYITSLFLILGPSIFLLLLGIISVALIDYGEIHPSPEGKLFVPRCKVFDNDAGENGMGFIIPDSDCSTIIFAPDEGEVRTIMTELSRRLDFSIGTDIYEKDVVGFVDSGSMADHIIDNPGRTFIGLNFNISETLISYEIWYNKTLLSQNWLDNYDMKPISEYNMPTNLLGVQFELDQSILAVRSGISDFSQVNIKTTLQKFPEVKDDSNYTMIITAGGSIFIFLACMINFVVYVNILSGEKENNNLAGLRMFGLKEGYYWLSWFFIFFFLNIFTCLFYMIMGYIWGIFLIIYCDFGIFFVLLLLFIMSTISMSMFISAVSPTTKVANLISIILFFFGFAFQAVLSASSELSYLFYDPETIDPGWKDFLEWYPPFSLAKCIYDIYTLTKPYRKFDETLNAMIETSGEFTWDHMYEGPYQVYNEVPSFSYSLLTFIYCTLLYGFASWYISQVFPGRHGSPKPFYFFLNPYYWWPTKTKYNKKTVQQIEEYESLFSSQDIDVKNEAIKVISRESNNEDSIEVELLSRDFVSYNWDYPCNCYIDTVNACDNISFNVSPGKIFCLLGHNGAGKTTAVNMMSGMLKPLNGDVFIRGYSMSNEPSLAHDCIGTCPQFDILWSPLTANEHLEIFCQLKGMYGQKMKDFIRELLENLRLSNVADHQISTYSGGMKRRISVGLAFMGDPPIVMLDEPTTGIDPFNRRFVWDLIESFKSKKAIFLTTHSMEEADYLGDVIAIMSKGRLSAIGNSLHLKHRFGAGYQLTLLTHPNCQEFAKEAVSKILPEAQLLDCSAGNLLYSLTSDENMNDLFSYIEENPKYFKDWELKHTTLEDVFLKLFLDEKKKEIYKETDKENKTEAKSNNENENEVKIKIENQPIEMDDLNKETVVSIPPDVHKTNDTNIEMVNSEFIDSSKENTEIEMDDLNKGIVVSIPPDDHQKNDQNTLTAKLRKSFPYRAQFLKSFSLYRRQTKTLIATFLLPLLMVLMIWVFQAILVQSITDLILETQQKVIDGSIALCNQCSIAFPNEPSCIEACKTKLDQNPNVIKYPDSASINFNPSPDNIFLEPTLPHYLYINKGVDNFGFLDGGSIIGSGICFPQFIPPYNKSALSSGFLSTWPSTVFPSKNLTCYPLFSQCTNSSVDIGVHLNCSEETCAPCNYILSPVFSNVNKDGSILTSNTDIDQDLWDRQKYSKDLISKYSLDDTEFLLDYVEELFPSAAFVFKKIDIDPNSRIDIEYIIRTYLSSNRDPYPLARLYLQVSQAEKSTRMKLRSCETLSCIYDTFDPSWRNLLNFPTKNIASGVHSENDNPMSQLLNANIGSIYLNQLYNAMTTSILNKLNSTYSIQSSIRDMPYKIYQKIVWDTNAIMSMICSSYIPFCISFAFPLFVYGIVHEKEHKLISYMKMMGLKMNVYWVVNFFVDFLISILLSFTVYCFALIMNIHWFFYTHALVWFLIFFCWSFSLVSFSFFVSIFFSKTRTAMICSYILVLVSNDIYGILNMFVFDSGWMPWAYHLFPFWSVGRAITLLGKHPYQLEHLVVTDELITCFGWFFFHFIFFLLLTFYLEEVIPKEYGVTRHPLFFLDPIKSYFNSDCCPSNEGPNGSNKVGIDENIIEDEDVHNERVFTESAKESSPVMIKKLVKNFGNKIAVNNVSFHVEVNQTFGLLGPNGAGKTTIINMLTGLYSQTHGSAQVAGFSIDSEMDKIYRCMSTCPQFDIHWPDLTVEETLLFYARLKGVEKSEEAQTIKKYTALVGLTDEVNKQSSDLSGGMRRRLSLAMSLIGDPDIIFLDEPTTGLDVETRRKIWQVIEDARIGRVIILTTHSMEEADSLCTRIAIMTDGQLQCIGSNLHLKNKFGEGYILSFTYQKNRCDDMHNFVMSNVPSATVIDDNPGVNQRSYKVHREKIVVSKLFENVKIKKESVGILEWSFSQTSLEDVFQRIALKSINSEN